MQQLHGVTQARLAEASAMKVGCAEARYTSNGA